MATTRQSRLQLNPGGPRRRQASLYWCFFWTTTSFLLVALLILNLFEPHKAFKRVHTPHTELYYNATPVNRDEVIRPLVDEKETFDIVASVWVRDDEEGGKEEALYSDVVFRGVTVKSKGVMGEVEVKVPTASFKRKNLTNFDLRGSFALIPTNKHLLNNVVRYTSWMPDEIKIPPSQPLDHQPKLHDEIINNYSLNIPLVEFHPVHSTCHDEESEKFPTDDEINEVQDKDYESVYRTNERMRVLLGHPYLVTRSHIRVADFTQLLKYDEFSKAYEGFRRRSCGQGQENTTVSYYSCLGNEKLSEDGLYKTTLLELNTHNDDIGKGKTEWAYTPYLSFLRNARGPLDLQRVPVNRQECKNLSSPDEEFTAISWKITFSGRSPLKSWVGDKINTFHHPAPNMSDPTYNFELQRWTELRDGIHGHRHGEDAHPRAYLGIWILKFVGGGLIRVLDFLYWYTRVSTVGISISGYILTLSSDLLEIALIGSHHARMAYEAMLDADSVSQGPGMTMYMWVWAYLLVMVGSIGPIWIVMNVLKAKVMMRVQVSFWWGLIPTFKKLPANHSERASMRMDGRVSWTARISAALCLVLLTIYMNKHHLSTDQYALEFELISLIAHPINHIGIISQLLLNHRAKTFGSMYKLTSYLLFFNSLLWYIPSKTFLVAQGGQAIVDSKYWNHYVTTVLEMVMVLQAVRYPYARYVPEEDDD